jgi:hypothetical protein
MKITGWLYVQILVALVEDDRRMSATVSNPERVSPAWALAVTIHYNHEWTRINTNEIKQAWSFRRVGQRSLNGDFRRRLPNPPL